MHYLPTPRPPWRTALGLLLLGLLAPPALGQDRGGPGPNGYRHLIAAYTFHVDSPTGPYDAVVLGRYDFLDDRTVDFFHFLYDARKNPKPSLSIVRHPRMTPGNAAQPALVKIPTPTVTDRARGTWMVTEDGLLRMQFGNLLHDWVLRNAEDQFFTPAHPYVNVRDNSHSNDGARFSNMVGYAYLSDYATLPRRLTRDDLLTYYDGETYMHTKPKGQAPRWERKSSGLHQEMFTLFESPEGDVLGLANQSKFMKPPMWVFSNFLLNYDPRSKLLAYSEGGHDFNRNTVYDEFGHNIQLYGVFDGRKVSRFVYIECSYQTAGYPLLMVGHYYPPTKAAAGPAAASAPPARRPAAYPPPRPATVRGQGDDDFLPPLPPRRPRP